MLHPIILGFLVLLGTVGCESGSMMLPRGAGPGTGFRSLAPTAARPDDAERAVDPTDAPSGRVRPTTIAAEPIARDLVETILDAVPDRHRGTDDWTVIGLSHLRNHSHAAESEFRNAVERLAALLTATGIDERVRFVVDPGTATHYELGGTAYLVTADGFDQWEIYLRLSPADEAWTLRTWDEPLRMLRRARAGGPQLTRGPTSR